MNFCSSDSYNYDFEDIMALIEEVDPLFKPPLSDRVDLKSYTEKINKLASLELAYTDSSELVGMIAYYNNDYETKRAYITFLGVTPKFQGQGVAKRLVETCIANCSKNGMKNIGVETWESNTPVLKLYKKFGFKVKKVNQDRKNVKSVKLIKQL